MKARAGHRYYEAEPSQTILRYNQDNSGAGSTAWKLQLLAGKDG